jgi:hypothetical protein
VQTDTIHLTPPLRKKQELFQKIKSTGSFNKHLLAPVVEHVQKIYAENLIPTAWLLIVIWWVKTVLGRVPNIGTVNAKKSGPGILFCVVYDYWLHRNTGTNFSFDLKM